jgi:hypothetical protein
MTTLKSTVFAAVAGILALQPLAASVASAQDWRHRGGYGGGYHRPYGPPPAAYGYGRPQYAYPERRRDRGGKAAAAAILGIGALIVGAAIADAARREHRQDYRYDRRYD